MKISFRRSLLSYLLPFLFPVTIQVFVVADTYVPLNGFLLLLALLLVPLYILMAGPSVLFYFLLLQAFPPAYQEIASFKTHFDSLVIVLELFFGWILFGLYFHFLFWSFKNKAVLYTLGVIHLITLLCFFWIL